MKKMVILLTVACIVLAGAANAATFNLTSQFGLNTNPRGAWSYGVCSNDFTSWSFDYVTSGDIWSGLVGWYGDADATSNKIPFLGAATTANPDGTNWGEGYVGGHSDNRGAGGGAGAKWTNLSGSAVSVDISAAAWRPRANQDVGYKLVINGVVDHTAPDVNPNRTSYTYLTPYTYNKTGVTLAAGESLWWVAYNITGADYYGMDLTVTTTAVPEPGSILALGSGLFGLLGFAWRKRH